MSAAPAHPISVSLFALLRQEFGSQLEPLRCSKATLVHLSHSLEDLVLTQQLPAILFTGFQESSHWREETERYRALASIAQQVCIFAGGELPPESAASEIHVRLQGDDPLRQEWFLILLCPQFSVLLCGQDRQVAAEEEALRQFDTLWSFEPGILTHVLELLEQVVAHYRPDRLVALREARQAYQLVAPDPKLVTRFTSEIIRFEEELHRTLHKATNALTEQLRWREDLTAMLAHDMRAPLQGIVSMIELFELGIGLDPETMREMLTLAKANIYNLTSMIQLILDTNRLATGHFRLTWKPTVAESLITEALAPLQIRVATNKLTLSVEIDDRVRVIWGDSELLVRVIQNIVSNSLKFTPAGGRIMIGVVPAPSGTQLELRIRDSGAGIASDALPYVFERYYQGRTDDNRGVGLGLYFCRLVAEAHGGQIRVASQLGQGTTITLVLPLRPLTLQ